MADELNLKVFADRVSATLLPHLRESTQSSNSFRQAAMANSGEMKKIVKDLYNAISSQKNDISSLSGAIESNNQYTLDHASKTAETNSLLRQNIQLQNMIIGQLNNLNTATRASTQSQSLAFAGVRQGLEKLGKYYDFGVTKLSRAIFGRLGNNATYQAIGRMAGAVGGGALGLAAGGAALGALGSGARQLTSTGAESPEETANKVKKALESERNEPPSGPSGPSGSSGPSGPSGEGNKPELSGKLGEDRQKYFGKELEKNPNLLRELYNRTYNEDSKNPENFLESVFNRAMFGGKSLGNTINNKGYFPGVSFKDRKPTEKQLEEFRKKIDEIMKGRNVTDLATDNASDEPGNPVATRRERAGVTGKRFPSGPGKGELYYRGGSGAGKYKTKHGVAAEKYKKQLEEEERKQKSSDAKSKPSDQSNVPDAQKQPGSAPQPGSPDSANTSASRVRELQRQVAGTRKGELDPRLRKALDYASSQTGLQVDVTSGGQRMPGAPGHTGTHRHDQGKAADFNLIDSKTGKIISPNDPRALEFMRKAGEAGVTGGGAGYMRGDPNKIHLDIETGKMGKPIYAGSPEFRESLQQGINQREQLQRQGGTLPEQQTPSQQQNVERKTRGMGQPQQPQQQPQQQPAPPQQTPAPPPEKPQIPTPIPASYGEQLNRQAIDQAAKERAVLETERTPTEQTQPKPDVMNVDYRNFDSADEKFILNDDKAESGKYIDFTKRVNDYYKQGTWT